MSLARDLNELIQKYGSAIAAGAESVLVPRHKPGAPLPDLSEIEACRTTATGRPFTFYPSQREKIAGALAGLKAMGRVWEPLGELAAAGGQGKRIMMLVPSAQALVALRTRIANKQMSGLNRQAELFVDAAHPSAPLEAFNTYLHYAVLYSQSPVGLPMPGPLKNAKRDAWDEKFNISLEELAWETVTHYSYSGVIVAKNK